MEETGWQFLQAEAGFVFFDAVLQRATHQVLLRANAFLHALVHPAQVR